MLISKKRFQPKFWIGTCPMRKTILPIIRDIEPTAFFMKKNHFLWNFSLVIFMGNPSLRLSQFVVAEWMLLIHLNWQLLLNEYCFLFIENDSLLMKDCCFLFIENEHLLLNYLYLYLFKIRLLLRIVLFYSLKIKQILLKCCLSLAMTDCGMVAVS